MFGGLVLAGPAFAADGTGGAGGAGPGESSVSFPPELIGTEGAGITVSKVTDPATGENGGPGGTGTGIDAVGPAESSNGTGGAGGSGGAGTSGGIGALDIILNEDIDNPLSVTLTTGAATGGRGGTGGAGTGGTAGIGGTGGTSGDGIGGNGGPGGPANGLGGAGGAGGRATGGGIDAMTITVTGDILSAATVAMTGGSATGGTGGAGGAGKGGTAGTGGAGGDGINYYGGRGGAGGAAAGTGGAGGVGGDAMGGGINALTVSITGDILSAATFDLTGGSAIGAAGGVGGAGTGGTAGAGGAGGSGGVSDDGGRGGAGGYAVGQGGAGGAGGDAYGGGVGAVTITVTGNISSATALNLAGGSATGGAGGAGGAGKGGTAGAGGAGGYGDNGGIGGAGGSAAGLGGAGDAGGHAFGGGIRAVAVTVTGDITSATTLDLTGGSATGGAGGAGGSGTGGTGGAGGPGGNGYDAGSGNQGGSAAGQGGAGGAGGDAVGGSIGAVTVTVTGDITAPATLAVTGGSATGGAGGAGGAGWGGAAGAGGLAGNGEYDGGGGAGGSGSGLSRRAGIGGDAFGGGIKSVTVTVTGDITSATTLDIAGGSATGGAGGAGGNGQAEAGGAGRTSGRYGGNGGGGGSADGLGGAGGAGGNAFGGGIGTVALSVTGNITAPTTLEITGGSATGGAGGAGGAGIGGTAGAGGAGGYDYYGGTGGGGGSSAGLGGAGGEGGDASGGGIDAVALTVTGDIAAATTLAITGGSATGGAGGAGGVGSSYVAGAAGSGGSGTYGGDGGTGGSADGLGGAGGAGGDAFGGGIDLVTVTVTGDITSATTLELTGGSATGGAGGVGGAGTAGAAGAGGAAGNGPESPGNAGAGGSAAGLGGAGGAGGNATGGDVYATMTSNGTITLTGDAITITALAGAATGGAGGTGGSANGRTGANGANATIPGGDGSPGGVGGPGGTGGTGAGGGIATGGDATVAQTNSSDTAVTGDAITITAKAGDATGGAGGAGGSANGGLGGTGGYGIAGGSQGIGGFGGNGGTGGAGGDGGDAQGGNAVVGLSNSGDLTVTGGTAITIVATAGDGTGGAGGAGGSANGGNRGSGIYDPNGTNSSGGTGGDGGAGGDGAGGNATVEVANEGRIFATGNGIDVIATAGTGTGGAAGAGGTANAGTGLSLFPGTPGIAGDPGLDGTGTNGSSSITVDNSGVVDVDGIGVKALAKGDNGTIQINNTGGTITGDAGGVVVATDLGFNANSDIDIVNSGLISSGNLLAAAAIDAKGASAELRNAGMVLGFVDLTELGDTFDNEAGGVFAARGTSDFRGGDDQVNNAGTVHTAGDPLAAENVVFENLERFGNSGWISLVDGQEGDSFTLKGTDYESTGGRLAVDAELGPSGKSDLLIIDGATASTSGVTRVSVNVTDVTGANTDGITVVEAINGATTHDGDFALDGGTFYAGFYTWDMRRDGDTFELFTSGVGGAGAYEFAAGITGAQDIWYQTIGTLLQRQADLRPLLAGTQVTPVADFSEPVAPTPAGQVGPGFWMKGVGAWLERDQGDGVNVTDRKQSIYGGLAGFDFATQGAGDAWLFGLYGGYLGSKLKFSETNNEWTYDGPTVGAYATYLNEALYVDMLVKADFLNIDIDPDGLDGADTDGVNVGGMIDAGYKFGGDEGVFIEPQATLAVLHTQIDDVDIFGGTVEFEDETSVRGRLGLRLGYDHTAANAVVYSSDVTASVWQEFNGGSNDVSIVTADFPAFGVSDEPGETVGDISLGFSVAAPEGWSGFLRGNYQFSEDLDAIAGSAGLRYSW